MTTIEDIEKAYKCCLHPGGLLVLCVEKKYYDFIDFKIRQIMPLLKSKNIGVLLLDEDTSFVMVPESRRIITMPKETV